jgi:hypothetical protein
MICRKSIVKAASLRTNGTLASSAVNLMRIMIWNKDWIITIDITFENVKKGIVSEVICIDIENGDETYMVILPDSLDTSSTDLLPRGLLPRGAPSRIASSFSVNTIPMVTGKVLKLYRVRNDMSRPQRTTNI